MSAARAACLALVSAAVLAPLPGEEAGPSSSHWPQFRGPNASGVAAGRPPPESWDVSKGANVRWKTPILGLGHSSPVVWGDRVFVTTARGEGDAALRVGLYGDIGSVAEKGPQSFLVLCLDRRDGRVLWSRTAREGPPRMKRHPKSSHANPTPATDGSRVIACFGAEGMYAYDLEGKLLWEKDLGPLDSGFYRVPAAQWGFASSPVIHRDRVILQCDVQSGSFLAAFDLKDGKEVWRTPRSDVPTWSTPAIHEGPPRAEVIVNGYRHSGGYDPATGKELWKLPGGGDIPVPTPVIAHGLVYLSSAHGPRAPLRAVKLGAAGDLAGEAPEGGAIAWTGEKEGTYMQCPIVLGDLLYACKDNGVLSCYEARTGKRLYRERLGDGRTGFTASPVAAGGRLYFASEEGEVHVVATGPEFKLLARNPMGEVCMATPALSDGMLIVRARGHLYAIAADPE